MKIKEISEKVSPNKYTFEVLCDFDFFNEYLKLRGFSYDGIHKKARFETTSHQAFLQVRKFLKYLSLKAIPEKIKDLSKVPYEFQPTTITWTPIRMEDKSPSRRKTKLKDVLRMEAAEPKGSRRESE